MDNSSELLFKSCSHIITGKFSAKDVSKLKRVRAVKGIVLQLVSSDGILSESTRISFTAFQGRMYQKQ